ncbi:anosmin-1-like [Amblyraja radiata]|uniref:anosmin-1-like n=1 Tax=Amblyraja radiata TaxID=386614 RepID=UPI0014028A25|nr:anosmin-1-like [Amblyraja radiata]
MRVVRGAAMRCLLPGLLCWLLPAGARRPRDTGNTTAAHSVSRARCTSRCLTLHIAQLSASFRSLQNDEIVTWCEGHRRCTQCLQPCKVLWDTNKNQCQQQCEKHHECLTSCEFLRSIQTVKQGNCPAPQRASGFAAACIQSCNVDTECPSIRKCCPNGCGQTCQTPANMFKGVPLRPKKELSFAEDKSGKLSVAWMSRFNVSMEPVFYILQRRWNSGMYPSEDDASKWETVAYTTEEHVGLKNMRPNIWYQFRVAAVNIHGTRGFTTPSKHFHSSRDPSPPDAPSNLRKDNFTARHNGAFSLRIHWDPPQEKDLYIHHYKMYWSQWVSRKTVLLTKKENWKIIDGVKDEVEIEDLQPNTQYLVQVQSVANWGQKRLKSSKALFFFTTPSTDIPSNEAITTTEVSNELPHIHQMFDIGSLEAADPYYHGNQLQVKVHWKKAKEENLKDHNTYLLTWMPESCAKNNSQIQQHATVKGTHFIISGLLFACDYKVTVQPIILQGQAPQAITYVTTPHCSNSIKAKVLKRLFCAKKGLRQTSIKTSRKVTLKAEKLTATFVAKNGSVNGEFHWQVLRSQHHQQVTGYQINWSEISTANRPVVMPNKTISQFQILPSDQPFTTIPKLRPSTTYWIQVQVLTTTGKGPATVKIFQLPPV